MRIHTLSYIVVVSMFLVSMTAVEAEESGTASAVSQSNSPTSDVVKQGQKLALEFCQACHHYSGTEQAGTVAPPLLGMKGRFPDRKKLFDIIYDPQQAISKNTMMPPFGRNELLAKEEIEKVIEFLYSL